MDSVPVAVTIAVSTAFGAALTLACAQKPPPPPPPPPPAAKFTIAQRFEGKVAVVTGAASGLGLATSERILRDGGCVLMTDVNEAALTAAVERLGQIKGAERVRGVAKDISSRAGAVAVVAAAEVAWGHVDVLVNSAGITARNVRPEADFEERWDAVMKVNVKGSMLMCHAAVEAFRRRRCVTSPRHAPSLLLVSSFP